MTNYFEMIGTDVTDIIFDYKNDLENYIKHRINFLPTMNIINLIEETNKPGKFNAGKFAEKHKLSMEEVKAQAKLLQKNISGEHSDVSPPGRPQ